ncbi:MAG: hypothetical protein KAR45_02085 [Desulfobacteraceae bacterium]|nr:hypothetical protein [Desulfobacteraceae bacterium]
MLRLYKLIRIIGLLILFSSFFMPLAFGEESTESGIWESFQENFSPQIDINLRWAYFHKDSTLDPEDYHLSGNVITYFSKELFSGITLRVDPRINFDTIYTNGAQFFIEDNEYRPTYTFNEALISWYGESIEIEVGKKIYSWKVADGFSPLDTLNPLDLIELMNPEKIGIPSISVLKMFDIANIQVVFLPFFVPDRQPDNTSRWTTDDPEGRTNFINQFGMEPVNVDVGRLFPDDKLSKSSIAARVSSSTLLNGWDLALIYRYGHSTRGVIRNDIDIFTLPIVRQTTEYPAYKLYGFSFSTVVSDFEFHGEAAFHDTLDNLKDEDYLSYIVGINYTNYDWFSNLFDEIRFVAEYAGEKTTKKRDTGSTFSDKGVCRGMTSDIIGSIEFKINEDHSIKTSYIYNFADEDSMLDMFVESQLNDYLKLTCGFQRLSGDEDSFFGQWDRNDRIYIKMLIKY